MGVQKKFHKMRSKVNLNKRNKSSNTKQSKNVKTELSFCKEAKGLGVPSRSKSNLIKKKIVSQNCQKSTKNHKLRFLKGFATFYFVTDFRNNN